MAYEYDRKAVTVAVVVGSKTDLPIVAKSGIDEFFHTLSIGFEVNVISAHRNPDALKSFCDKAISEGVKIFIGIAGWAAALPGAIAAATEFTVPVIGAPLGNGPYQNDALYSVASMPPGCPVLVCSLENAGLAAAQILALSDDQIREGLIMYLSAKSRSRPPQYNVNLEEIREKDKEKK
jgi:5-(carboxyamino)imidazole ribonucleotide mutase